MLRKVDDKTRITLRVATIITVVSEFTRMETGTNSSVGFIISNKSTYTIIERIEITEPVSVIKCIYVFYDSSLYSIDIFKSGFIR